MMSLGVRKGAWTKEEDVLLSNCVEKYGEGKWHLVPLRAGLNRCRKSCRMRWLNYLKPNIKRGEFSEDEVDLMMRLHRILGNRWSLIAGRLPGRTAKGVNNYWNAKLRHMVSCRKEGMAKVQNASKTVVIKPQPWTFYKSPSGLKLKIAVEDPIQSPVVLNEPSLTLLQTDRVCNTRCKSLLADLQEDQGTQFWSPRAKSVTRRF